MKTFILCINYHGPRPNLDQSLDEREDKAFKLLNAAGGKLITFFRTQGRFDVVVVVEMHDAETMHAFNLAMQDEHYTVETMRAFIPDEFPPIWKKAASIYKQAGIKE